ncbi:MAG: alkaline phosphatase family protein [Oscillospiraceae bacterium]|nr:alkaline phosphatase family protein [Oscillospiraceae bacterium]
MKKLTALVLATLTCLGLIACAGGDIFTASYVPILVLDGDVENVLTIDAEFIREFELSSVNNRERKMLSVTVAQLLEKAQPRSLDYNILLAGVDGLQVVVNSDNAQDLHIGFSPAYGWECVTESYPPSAKVKMLTRIVVISQSQDYAAAAFEDDSGRRMVSVGQLALENTTVALVEEGKNEIEGNFAQVHTTRRQVPAANYITAKRDVAVFGRDGRLRYDRKYKEACLEINGNELDYVFADGTKLENIAGILADAPSFNISEAFSDTLHFLRDNERVLLIELDGWGWMMYNHFLDAHSYLRGTEPRPALAAYPPISPTGLATLLTGELPDVHGVTDRNTRSFKQPDLFEEAKKLEKTSAYIEGNVKMLETSIAAVLSSDKNDNGTDDEIFENALKNLDNDLVFVHFHGIDDAAHTYGPYSKEVEAKIREVDGYVKELAARWQGRIIVTADHGLHNENTSHDRLGNHGRVGREDMLVPYVIVRK